MKSSKEELKKFYIESNMYLKNKKLYKYLPFFSILLLFVFKNFYTFLFYLFCLYFFRIRIWLKSRFNDSNYRFMRGLGKSMNPTIISSDILRISKVIPGKSIVKQGDIVVTKYPNFVMKYLSPGGGGLIKRVQKVEKKGVFLLGDNLEESTDSRTFGVVRFHSIKGIVEEIISVEHLSKNEYRFSEKSLTPPKSFSNFN